MKILIAFYYLNNLGGIINNQEGLVAGLQALGHDVTTKCLLWKDKISTSKSHRRLAQEKGVMGLSFDQELGWTWPASSRIAYKGKWNIERWKQFASGFDLIIWQIPVPTLQKNNRGNTDWLELYNVPVKQIAYTHDGNMEDSYPHIMKIKQHLCGVVGVHPCAYHALKKIGLPRAMAFSAQQRLQERIAYADACPARNGWISLQTFKGWKHVDDLVRAIPYMANDERRILAGGGIHYFYMTSTTKMKEEYLANRKKDPDIDPASIGTPIWNLACAAGMDYRGYVTNDVRDAIMCGTKFVIDPSWSKKYAKVGDHFNRTIVEGIINGNVPIARNLGVSTSEDGVGEFFKPGENYIMIPYDATPREFAARVDDAINLPEGIRKATVERGREMLKYWDCKFVAQTFIDMAAGKDAGVYADRPIGQDDPEVLKNSDAFFNSFFAKEGDGDDTESSVLCED